MALEICNEMKKLRDWLNENNIFWYDDSHDYGDFLIIRTKFSVSGYNFSVINGLSSFGGYRWEFENRGLLECMIDNHEPEGWLTAEDVEKRIKSIWETEKKESTNITVTS